MDHSPLTYLIPYRERHLIYGENAARAAPDIGLKPF